MTDKDACLQVLVGLIAPYMDSRDGLPVHGVSIFLVHDGRETILGREKEGMNQGMYHAFGGSACKRKDAAGANLEKIAQVCYEELQEELGLCLDVAMLKKCFSGAFWVPFEDAKLGMRKTTLVIVLNIAGVSVEKWMEEYKARITSFADSGIEREEWWKWCEMDSASFFNLDEALSESSEVSSFVRENWQQVVRVHQQNAHNSTTVNAADFKWAKPRASEDGHVEILYS